MNSSQNILMVAAENDALPGCKVGGIGDVVRDIPPALAQCGCRVMVITPSYGFLHKLPSSSHTASLTLSFAGTRFSTDLYTVSENTPNSVTHFVLDNADMFPPVRNNDRFQIYCHDPPDKPFSTDATRYAFFCKAVAEFILKDHFNPVDIIHLHDWHAAFLLILRAFDKRYEPLKKIKTVYTIHNLSIQGTRPLSGDDSSLLHWYPDLYNIDRDKLSDPASPDCINPMAAGIRLAERVHTVSPTYAQEILKPSRKPHGYGGEGLEKDLEKAVNEKRLFGILNGSIYPPAQKKKPVKKSDLGAFLLSEVLSWTAAATTLPGAHFIAYTRLKEIPSRTKIVLTSIGRIVEQKYFLLRATVPGGKTALETILDNIKDTGIFILLGTGDPAYEAFLRETSARYSNFIFLNSYSERSAEVLFQNGDMFIMPSSFEPCGIAQMVAMRHGQICLVNAVGGLKDTVKNGINGFVFSGETMTEKTDNFVKTCREAVEMKINRPAQWKKLKAAAKKSRFLWQDSVKAYIEKLYSS